MSRDYELDRLRSKEKAAFQRKQTAWASYADAKERASMAHEAMDAAWNERCRAREEMNQEYEAMQASSEHYREVWDEYGRIRDYNNARIESLRYEADAEHRAMVDCFEQASSEYEYGDKAVAPMYASEGHDHKDRRDALNCEISALCQEVKAARQTAEYQAPKTDSSAFRAAKAVFEQAKASHESAQAEFKRLKAIRDSCKEAFNTAQAEHARAKEAFQRRLEQVKSAKQRERDKTLDKAGIRFSDRKNAKIVKKSDGTTQIYSGGIGQGDGAGHGHVALDSAGRKTYDRKAFSEHGSQNYTDEKTRWDGPHHGVIIGKDHDHEVTFSQGMGKNAGQTVIADGYLSKRKFHPRHSHNHYGPDTKYGDGSERIENKGGDRGKYTGPGH